MVSAQVLFKDFGSIFKLHLTIYGSLSNNYFPEFLMAASEPLWLNISKTESK